MAEFDPDAYLAKKEKKSGFDPDAYLAKTQPKPETALQTFGRSTASMADSALNALTGTLDYGAYALARAAGRSPEQAQAETTSPKDVVGRAFGVTGTAGYEQAPLRQLGGYVGETVGQGVVQPVAQATGIPEADVGNMLNSLAMGVAPVAGRATAATGRAVAAAPRAVADVAGGFTGAITGKTAKPGVMPEPWQQPSVRQPVSEKYYTPAQLEQWRAGELPTDQLTPQPIQNLGPEAMSALSRTQGNVPYAGQGFRAFGEQLGETYRNPLNLLTDVGLDVLTGGGLPTLGRLGYKGYQGIQGARAAKTLEGSGFSPLFPEEFAALERGQPHPSALGPMPTRTAPAAGPVAPQDLPRLTYNPTQPVMYVAPEGVAGTDIRAVNQAGIQQKYPEVKVGPVVPDTAAVAAQRAAESAANKQRILDLIAETKAKQPSAAEPTVTEPTVAPVAPTELPAAPVAAAQPTRALTAAEIRRQLYPPRPGETPDAFEARVQEVLARQPKEPEVAAVVKPSSPTEITEAVKMTGKGAVQSKDRIVSVDKTLYDDAAANYGTTIDWTDMPNTSGMSLAEARATIDKFVNKQIKRGVGPIERGPQMRTLQKQAEAELGITDDVAFAPETLKRIGSTGKPAAAPTINPALQAALDKMKSQGKYKPPGTMEMITDAPDAAAKIKAQPWLERTDFEQAVFMNELGLNAGGEFIAKMRAPEGSIIRAIDNTLDSEAIQYNDNTGFMTRKYKEVPDAVDYSVFAEDGVRYEIQKSKDNIDKIEIRQGDKVIAIYEETPFTNGPAWAVNQEIADGMGGMIVYPMDAKTIGTAETRRLHKELPKIDFNEIVNEQLARAEALRKGK